MKQFIFVLMALIFLSGCALSTIRPPKKKISAPTRKAVVTERKIFKPKPIKPAIKPVKVEQKEEVLPLEEEEIK